MTKKILLFGEKGQLAWELKRSMSLLGNVLDVGSKDCSFENPSNVKRVIQELSPDIIVNAAAYTNSERAEEEPEKANQVNGYTVGVIAEEAKRLKIPLVHYSTDYVFDGTKTVPWVETDVPNPLNAYGRSKVLGEQFIQQVGGYYLIFRVSWVYGSRGTNFYRTMLKLGRDREEIRVVDDQVGAPTWSRHIADATSIILSQADITEKKGVYHLSAQGMVSWYGFAERIFSTVSQAQSQPLKVRRLVAISSKEYPSKVLRPAYSVMDNTLLKDTFGVSIPSWDNGLQRVFENDFSS